MATGDNNKIWFPRVIDALKSGWDDSLSWEECAVLVEKLTERRDDERKTRGIKVKTEWWCSNCQAHHDIGPEIITIRAMIFALRKFGVINDAKCKTMDKDWRYYRQKYKLNGHGRPKEV